MGRKKDAGRNRAKRSILCKSMLISLSVIAAISLSVFASSANAAATVLITPQEHWKYNVMWIWDSDLRKSVGLVAPKIVIQNETIDRIEGYIGDQNGTRLTMYNDQQVVMVRFELKNGFLTDWKINDNRMKDGLFVIDIPSSYQGNLDAVRIFIGNNDYAVDDGTQTSPYSQVFINSARFDYKVGTASNIVNATSLASTNITEQIERRDPSTLSPADFGGSLIDYILNTYGFSPV
jgi:hypothetical protein